DATSFAGEWRADETAERLIRAGTIEPIIIVAIANAGVRRVDEYTPTVYLGEGGDGDRYARFVMTELKPFIDKTYRTLAGRDSTGVCGSSLGGLISLHMARTYPDQIGLCAAVSPSLWWSDRQLLHAIEKDPSWTEHCRIWLDMGTAETSPVRGSQNVENTRQLAAVLERAGRVRGIDFEYLEVADGQHNEAAWAERFPQILEFLFGRRKSAR
ncbi:MAG: alpha/beta hydrolase-fold protein, partial [Phycisphaerales bacterium]|nr:alpha/beta hydrolase-fold protein [Phycisphaerales bacterium]